MSEGREGAQGKGEAAMGRGGGSGLSPYEDILHLPHHVSGKRPKMPMSDRAAQFSPFAALTGHEDQVEEAARLTDERPELDESEREALDRKMRILREAIAERPEITVTFFREDERKEGGSCRSVTGRLERLDDAGRAMLLSGGERIAYDDVIALESERLCGMEGMD